MKTICILIASSAELKRERMELVDLMQDMNDDLDGRNIKLKPVLWEYMDSSMGEMRKEDEYLEKMRECEICIVLFWLTLGEYTVEELNVAVTEMYAGRLPQKVYVLFKEPADDISDELYLFKQDFPIRYGTYPSTFTNFQSLRETVKTYIITYIIRHTMNLI